MDYQVTRNVPISLGLVLLRQSFIQLRLDHFFECTALLNDTIEIDAERSVDKVTIALSDCPLLEVISYLDIAFFLPRRSRFLKEEQGDNLGYP